MEPSTNPFVSAPLPLPPRRPTGLTTLCVLTIILGSLGTLVAVQTLAGFAMQFAGGNTLAAGPGVTPEMAEVQKEMQAATNKIVRKYLPFSSAALVLQVGLCAGLLYGGIQTLKLRESGRRVLLKTFVAGLVIEPIRTVVGAFASYDMLAMMPAYMNRVMDATGPPGKSPPPQVGMMMGRVMYFAMIAGIIFYFIWLIVKCGYFIWARNYLRRAEITKLFS